MNNPKNAHEVLLPQDKSACVTLLITSYTNKDHIPKCMKRMVQETESESLNQYCRIFLNASSMMQSVMLGKLHKVI